MAGSLGQGGAERQLVYILKALTAQGADCRVLSFQQDGPYAASIDSLAVDRVPLPASRLARLYRLAAEVRAWGPDLLLSTHTFVNSYVAVAGLLTGVTAGGALRRDPRHEIAEHGLLGRLSLALPRLIVGNSRAALDQLASFSRARTFYLPNAVDTDWFQPARQTAERLVGVGSLRPVKRHDIFLEVVRQTGASALLVGSGPERESLERAARGLPVEFAGSLDDVRAAYRQAALLLHTSDYEGMPNVILEAMACGLPVVATAAGGCGELIQHGVTGFLAPPGDAAALAGHVRALLSDPGLRHRMGTAGRAYVLENHHPDVLATHLHTLTSTLP
ncbi:MAG: glycosyltransferase [Chloroflexi bacterium]|nr:glycosyltransferase [Chloroflexota bacterium]